MAHGELTRVRAVDSIVVVETSIGPVWATAVLMAWADLVSAPDVLEATSHDPQAQ